MSDPAVQSATEVTPGLSQGQRLINMFKAPTLTFKDVKAGHRSWWLPFIVTALFGYVLWFSVGSQVTWKTVYDNQQKLAPEFAQRMMEQMPPEQRAAADARGPKTQAITWALSPIGLLLINMIMALVLWPTINFAFGGKTNYGAVLAVIVYSGLLLWPVRFILASVALFAGEAPDSFNIGNPAPTNPAAFLNPSETSKALYALLSAIDVPTILCLAVCSIGIAIVAGTKRTSGYIAVFGWWTLVTLFFVGMAAIMG